jgi:hypothetical protein
MGGQGAAGYRAVGGYGIGAYPPPPGAAAATHSLVGAPVPQDMRWWYGRPTAPSRIQ